MTDKDVPPPADPETLPPPESAELPDATPESSGEPNAAQGSPRKRNLAPLALGAGVLLVIGLLLWWMFAPGRAAGLLRAVDTPAEHLTAIFHDAASGTVYLGSHAGRVYTFDPAADSVGELRDIFDHAVTDIALTSDDFLMGFTVHGEVGGWQVDGATSGKTPGLLPSQISSAAAHPSRFEVAVGLTSGDVLLLGTSRRTIPGNEEQPVTHVEWLPTGNRLLVATTDGRVSAYRVTSGSIGKPRTIVTHPTRLTVLVIDKISGRIVTGDADGHWHLIRLADQQVLTEEPRKQPDSVTGVVWGTERLLTSSWDGRMRLWSIEPGVMENEFDLKTPVVELIDLPQRSEFLTIGTDGAVRIWDRTAFGL